MPDSDTRFSLKKNGSDADPEEREFDVAFLAVGVKPAAPDILLAAEDDHGLIRTDDYGRVADCDSRVFAFGACTIGEPKNGVTVMGYKDALAGNTLAAMRTDGEKIK